MMVTELGRWPHEGEKWMESNAEIDSVTLPPHHWPEVTLASEQLLKPAEPQAEAVRGEPLSTMGCLFSLFSYTN